jgi:hypothetical protein
LWSGGKQVFSFKQAPQRQRGRDLSAVEQRQPLFRAELNGALIPATEGLASVGLSPFVLGPKEGLALLNGTPDECGRRTASASL